MNTDACPERDVLGSHLLGKVHGEQAENIDQHLETCNICLETARALNVADDLTEGIQAGKPSWEGSESAIADVIERGKQLRSEVGTVQSEETLVVGRRDGKPSDDDLFDAEEIDFLAAPEQPDEIGRLGGYRVLEVLGVGGMGIVFRAEDPKLERIVALKAMKPAIAARKSDRDRFLREAKATASIEHDNIIPIYQVGKDRGVPFIAMPFLRGESLQTRLQREKKLDQRESLRIGREIAAGLAAAHKRDLIHRDIKPDNIWIEEATGRAKILDFGLVRAATDDAGLTQSGMVIGTPKYMAPEQAAGEPVDHRCDLFSLGSVLYRLIAGRPPFAGKNITAMLIAVTSQDPEPLHVVCPNLDADFAKLILRLLEKDRDKRPATAGEVVRMLTDIESDLDAKAEQEDATIEYPTSPDQTVTGSATPVAAPPSEPPATGNGGGDDNNAQRPVGPAPSPATATSWSRIAKTFVVMALVLIVPSLIYMAGTAIFRLVTPDGILVIEVDDPKNVVVEIDGETMKVKFTPDGKSIEVSVGRGRRRLTIKTADGTILKTDGDQTVEIAAGNTRKIRAWLERPKGLPGTELGRSGYTWPKDQPAPAIAPFNAEQAKQHQEAWAKHLGVEVETTNSIGMKFRVIPPGEFLMGTSDEEIAKLVVIAKKLSSNDYLAERIPQEGPQHDVTLTKPFGMSIHEVTRGQFRQFVEATAYKTDAEKNGQGGKGIRDGKLVTAPEFLWHTNLGLDMEQTDEHPVVNVSWNDAVAFCEWLSEKEGVTFRLPTEAEWEFACRAGSTTRFSFGDDEALLKKFAWYGFQGGKQTKPVGTKQPNALGLFDLHGNVFEWCHDWSGLYTTRPAINPTGPPEGIERVAHSAAFNSPASGVRSALRFRFHPSDQNLGIGFRIVRTFENSYARDRMAAEWFLENGQTIEIHVEGRRAGKYVKKGDPLLKEPFKVLTLPVGTARAKFTGKQMKLLKELTAIKRLDLSWVRVKDEDFVHLAGLTSLIELNLQNTGIGDEGVKHFAGLVNLRKLNLDNCSVTSKSFVVLKRLKNLQSIRFQNVTATPAERAQLEAALPKCKFIWSSDGKKPAVK